ncbi:MAG: SRPBCC domain-containing protein [Chitinophagaceae bacterium]|nr:SRPBCC domain-containing protein [Chitinophagaceae bacterium]
MKKLEFKIEIAASRQKVWDTMLDPVTYKKWVEVSWPASSYEGSWKQGENIKFISPSGEGTLATIVELRPYEFILANHIAVIKKDGSDDRDSEIAKGWVGTTESYNFSEKNGKTELKVEINTNPDWEKMFTDGWPDALAKLKEMSES